MGRMGAVQGHNKGRYGGGGLIGICFMVFLSILRCDISIIKSL